MSDYRLEHDSMGELKVPIKALYGAQTQRAVDNFPISGLPLPPAFIQALALIKKACAEVNLDLGSMPSTIGARICTACDEILAGKHLSEFPIDVFQTGSGTSTNMNANEVIAHLASREGGEPIHPNDHVNMGQSSNDIIPTTLHVAAALLVKTKLLPSLDHLSQTLATRIEQLGDVVKTGRTHLMDAMPLTLAQELSAWREQIEQNKQRIETSVQSLYRLALGGTAVGTGINAHPEFGSRVAARLKSMTSIAFLTSPNYFYSLSCQDGAVELSGQLRVLSVSLTKICNDLRWMNSGPLSGLSEIALPAIQPGSSIMPGKVNPVIPECLVQVAAQVIGNDATIAFAGQSGNFQLNVMLPVLAYNLLQSIELLSQGTRVLADKAIAGFTVNEAHLKSQLALNPILITALNSIIGYEMGAKIAKRAYAENRSIRDLALEMTSLKAEELDTLLDPYQLTQGGIKA